MTGHRDGRDGPPPRCALSPPPAAAVFCGRRANKERKMSADGALDARGESLWTTLTDDPNLQRYVPFGLASLYGLLAIGEYRAFSVSCRTSYSVSFTVRSDIHAIRVLCYPSPNNDTMSGRIHHALRNCGNALHSRSRSISISCQQSPVSS